MSLLQPSNTTNRYSSSAPCLVCTTTRQCSLIRPPAPATPDRSLASSRRDDLVTAAACATLRRNHASSWLGHTDPRAVVSMGNRTTLRILVLATPLCEISTVGHYAAAPTAAAVAAASVRSALTTTVRRLAGYDSVTGATFSY